MSPNFDAFAVALQGRNVVDASAGTGKTYAITSLVTRLVVERRLRIKDILVVTFTEAATAELRDRVRRRLRQAFEAFELVASQAAPPSTDLGAYAQQRRATAAVDRQWLALALEEVDEAPISTIHGFCHRVLQEAALESGVPFEAELIADARPLRDEAVDDFHSKDLATQSVADVRAILGAERDTRRLWQGLADKLLRNPDAKVVPADPLEREKTWALLRGRLGEVWNRPVVERLICTKAAGYKAPTANHVTNWCNQIDELVRDVAAPAEAPAGVKQLSRSGIVARGSGAPVHPVFDVLEDVAQLLSGKAGPAALVSAKHRFTTFLRDELKARKQSLGAITFDDLLLHLRHALRGPAARHLVNAVRKRFKAALIDEFQDTDPVQFEIFESLFHGGEGPLFLIGDPKQAIYGFRGADVNAYIAAVQAPGTQHHSMGVNWRSDAGLIAAVNSLFAPREMLPRPFVLEGIDFRPVAPRPDVQDVFATQSGVATTPIEVVLTCDDEGGAVDPRNHMAALVAADISRLLAGPTTIAGRSVVPADIAVLTRTNQQAVDVQEALRALQIPAVLLGDKSVLDSDEAKELLVVLAAVAEPTNAALLRNALATRLLGLSAHELVALESDASGWSLWSEVFRSWHELWISRGFVQMFRRFLEHEQVQPRLLGLTDGERRVTNLLHLMELVHRAARQGHLGPAGVVHWLGQAPSNAEGGVAPEEAQIRLESDEAAVKLTTVHRSKGLEYPIVFCPYVANEILMFSADQKAVRFHEADGSVTLDVGSAAMGEHVAMARLETLAENVRLLYVALTRAKHRCVLLWGYSSREFKETSLASLLYPLGTRAVGDDIFGSLGRLTEPELRAPLELWSARCEGAVSVRRANLQDRGVPYVSRTPLAPLLPAREPATRVTVWQRTTSFSGMTAAADHATASLAVARDHDELSLIQALPERGSQVPLGAFPRGAKAGNFFHELLETMDFAASAQALVPAVRAQLQLYRYDETPWSDVLPQVLSSIVRTPLDDGRGAFCLADLPPQKRIAELEFALPLGNVSNETPLQVQLAHAFAVDAATPAEERYAREVSKLHLGALTGFVKGFVDLVFEHAGRFFVLDYKTNHLGRAWADYAPDRLETAMVDGHYHLQSHLYALAVARHLARTLPGYDSRTHFGGVFYVFLRGMGGPQRPMSGVYFQRPSEARLAALDAIFPPGQVHA
ncbi:MAG: exodeoxyribonuclease V subunit beta [Deltaproteobacteria bacterium]|nr:exodeoxyribonuclease V subunit beta [Deltaproteobacteria bacterium]